MGMLGNVPRALKGLAADLWNTGVEFVAQIVLPIDITLEEFESMTEAEVLHEIGALPLPEDEVTQVMWYLDPDAMRRVIEIAQASDDVEGALLAVLAHSEFQ